MPNKKQVKKKKPNALQKQAQPSTKMAGSTSSLVARVNRLRGTQNIKSLVTDSSGICSALCPFDAIALSETRLANMFAMYEKYFVHSISVEYIPTVSKLESGTIHLAPDYDPCDPFPYSSVPSDIVQALSEMMGYRSGSISNRQRSDMRNFRLPTGEWAKGALYTSPVEPERFSSYGTFFAYVHGGPASTTVGSLVLHYDVEFLIPQPSSRATEVESTTIRRLSKVDTSGTVKPVSPVGLITEGLKFHSSGGAPLNVYASRILTGIIGDAAGLHLVDTKGEVVPRGTRIYARPLQVELNTNTLLDESSNVGTLNLFRDFKASGFLRTAAASAADYLNLSGVSLLKP